MRTLALASFAAAALFATTARADDTKPPVISEVKTSLRGKEVHVEARITDETGVLSAVVHHRGPGGQTQETPMVKNEYDDVFKASFAGGADTEYWIESSDLLGNGPATYGTASKPLAVGGGKGSGAAVATREPAPKRTRNAKVPQPPVVEHQRPGPPPPEGHDFAVRARIKSDSPVGVAVLQVKPQGSQGFTVKPLTHTGGDNWEGVISAAQAKGRVEYFILAKNEAGQQTKQGDGDATTPYALTFKPSQGSATMTASAKVAPATSTRASGPYEFSHLPLYRVVPGKPIVVRAQVVPSTENGQAPERVAVLWRGNDAQDQFTEMVPDETGGYGGFRAELPPQDEGAIFYQIVACDPAATRCGADTGSKRKWHAAMLSAQPGGAQPMPLDAVSSKAPPSLPE